MYETILNCPKCGYEVKLVADDVIAERDRLRAALQEIIDGPEFGSYAGDECVWIAQKALGQA